jgi:Domain of unknown function (DUF4406)
MKIYVAGKMRGLPYFGYKAFDDATDKLRLEGHEVFNPVEEGEKIYGDDVYKGNPDGDEELAGIDGRLVFGNDLAFVTREADAVALLPGWETSKGAIAEKAVAEALGLQVLYL